MESGIYNGITKGIAYTNMPYALAINSSGANVCGENAVNSGAAGKLDGFSIVLGHEIEETVTDPGAEDIVGTGSAAQNLGGWYDAIDANENGDKCAWVGESLGLPGEPAVTPIPGCDQRCEGQPGRYVRRAVAVEQRGGRRAPAIAPAPATICRSPYPRSRDRSQPGVGTDAGPWPAPPLRVRGRVSWASRWTHPHLTCSHIRSTPTGR